MTRYAFIPTFITAYITGAFIYWSSLSSRADKNLFRLSKDPCFQKDCSASDRLSNELKNAREEGRLDHEIKIQEITFTAP